MAFAIDGTPTTVIHSTGVTSAVFPAISTTFGKGKCLVEFIINGTTISSITGSGLAFTKIFAGQLGAGAGNSSEVWASDIGASALSSVAITVNFTGTATYSAGSASCFSNGGVGSIAFDAGGPTSAGTGTGNFTSPITTVNANTIVIGLLRSQATTNPTTGSGWTGIVSGLTGSFHVFEYAAQATTGTYTPTSNATDDNSAITVAIYVAASDVLFSQSCM